jgi:hypothetical protein
MGKVLPTSLLLGLLGLTSGCSGPAPQGPRDVKPDPIPVGPGGEDDDGAPLKPLGTFTVSKETTYATEPLDDDGFVDYAAALNRKLRQGVTPENNANVLLWKAIGPHPYDGTLPPAGFFEELGIEAPPERGDYFIGLNGYLKQHTRDDLARRIDEIQDEVARATARPWGAREYPDVAGWLKANEKSLALVVEATRRSHFFSPIVPSRTKKGSTGLVNALLPGAQICRDFARALTARAMLRLGEGAFDDAWQDLMTCHRLGRLVGRGATLLESLVGIAINRVAVDAELVYLDRARPDVKQLEKCLRDLRQLPPLPDIAAKLDLSERFMLLDSLQLIQRGGMGHFDQTVSGKRGASSLFTDAVLAGADWDPAMREMNAWYDRFVAAARAKDRASRAEGVRQVEADCKALAEKVKGGATTAELRKALEDGKDVDKALGKAIGQVLISMMLPAVSKLQDSADRDRQYHENLLLAFALARYQREHGHYPRNLAALAPKYVAEVPLDLFSGKALIYRTTEKGYLLYSVGVNGKDDGGREEGDDSQGDDITVRMPVPERVN